MGAFVPVWFVVCPGFRRTLLRRYSLLHSLFCRREIARELQASGSNRQTGIPNH
jgi:hypothetical protein